MCTGRGRRRFSPLQRLSPSLSQNPKQTDKAHTPPRAQAGEEGDFLPYNASLPLFPKTPNKPTRLTPHLVPRQGKKEIFSPTTHLSLSLPKPQTKRRGSHPTSCLAIEAKKRRREQHCGRPWDGCLVVVWTPYPFDMTGQG
jgi:hypothetical protein